MPTQTRSKKKPPASRAAASKAHGKSSAASTSRNGAKRQSGGSRGQSSDKSLATTAALSVRRISREAWGYLLIAVGALLALGIYSNLAGPAGGAVTSAASAALGVARLGLPLVVAGIGIELLRRSGNPLRTSISAGGLLLVTATILGLFSADSATSHAQGPGGLLGGTISAGMSSIVGRWGAGLLLLFGGLALVLVLTGTSIRDAINYCREVFSASGNEPGRPEGKSKGAHTQARKGQASAKGATATQSESVFDFDGASASTPSKRKKSKLSPDHAVLEPVVEESGQLAMPVPTSITAGANAYKLPDLSALKRSPAGNTLDEASLAETGRVLEATLRQFDVDATLSGVTPGPTVTRFEVELAPGVKVAKVKGLSDDIAYALAAERVRIQAPIPGKSAIGFEIPNRQRQLVTLGDILSSAAAKAAQHPLECALGKDIAGRPVTINLAQMPHLLIAGTTGGGKSSTINSFVTSLVMRNGPDRVRLILVDPKRVELGAYDGVPHLLTRVVTNPKKASEALAWAVREMERRYDILAEAGARDLVSYNHSIATGELKDDMGRPLESMGYIVVVVDELNDLMMVAARDVEDSIMRLAQMARAVGIHLVIATQRPSTNVITGVIKANIPSRIAFKVGSQVDSRVILDSGGAERLVGMGDMLMLTASSSSARRIQGCFVTEDEVRKVVAHWRRQSEPAYRDAEIFTAGESGTDSGALGDDDDDLLAQAMELVVRSQLGSTSMLQRKLRVGFARAGRLMDLLERKGVVGPSEGSKARTVLMTVEEFESVASAAQTSE